MPSDPTASRGPVSRGGPAGEVLRVLVIDENPRDRELIRESLRGGLGNIAILEIAQPEELESVLAAGQFDVVLADHRPSWIDAFQVLDRVRELFSYLPVILCTGTGSEELAVSAMKAGFDDYILKHPHHFPRLAPAIRSALEDSARRRVANEAETRYRSLFEGVPVGLYRATLSGQVLDANPALFRLLGFPSRESLMAVNLREIYVDSKSRRGFLERLEREGEVQDLELSWRRYGGQIITVRKSARPVRDSSGRLLHYEGVVEDITERRRAREDLKESNQFRQEIISGAGEGIVVYDRDLRYIVWNRYLEQMTGMPAAKVLGRKTADVFPFLQQQGILPLLDRALAGETAQSEDVAYSIPQTQRTGWAVATYGPHRNAAGEVVGVIGIVHDVTERRRAEQALRESEERFRNLADAAPVMIWMDDAAGNSIYFSKPWLDFTGKTLEQEWGQGSRRGIHPDDLDGFASTYERALAARQAFQTEYRLRRADGEYRWILESAIPRTTASGDFEGFIGSAMDITERRLAEQSVRENEERLRAQHEFLRRVIDADPNLVFAKDWEGRFTLANHAVAEIYGTSVENLVGKSDADFNPNLGEIEHFLKDDREVMRSGRPKLIVEEQVTDARSRITRWFQTIKVPLPPTDGGSPQVLGVATDISARKRSERLQSAFYRIAATTSSADDIDEFYAAIHGIVGELMYAKNLYVALYDPPSNTLSFPYCIDEADSRPAPKKLGKGLTEYVLRTGQPLLVSEENFKEMEERGDVELVGSWSVDWLGVPLKRGGTTFGVLVVQSYDPRFRFGSAEKEMLTFVSQQIAVALERKRVQDDIRESEERYRLLFERNLAGVYRTTLAGRILECNEALARMFGYGSREELLGRDIRALYPSDEDWQGFRESLLQFRKLTNYEMLGQRKDGSAVWTLENASLLADEAAGEVIVEGTASDITERKLLEEQLQQSQKMDAIGQLAGGIAHDFNNLLTAVLGYSDMALRQLSERDPVRAEIQEIQRAGDRAANLTRQLLAFSRKQVFEAKVVDVNTLIVDATAKLMRLIGDRIRLVTQLDPALGSVRADPGQLEQVISNLVINARDAMPQGGTLTMRTENVDVDAASARKHFGITPGRYAVFGVADTGAGIDAEAQKRVFEPFFTTKNKPHGAGLGLATAYGIVSQSGGQIFVSSEPGRGTEFAVYLPRESAMRSLPIAESDRTPRSGVETILLVEDEDAVRNLTRRLLETGGYTVLEASSAEQALEVAQRHSGRLDMLLTDVVMPGISGPELARQLLESRPQIRILYVSGYPDEAMASQGILELDASFLQKPFTPETLVRRVREILDATATAPIDH
ncbi:MAG: PAS domain S-box protein [Acidobacteriota bacterium]